MTETRPTTKQIIADAEKGSRIDLYNARALESIKSKFGHWKADTLSEQERKTWFATPHTVMGSEIPREMIYTPLDNASFDYENDLGFSGQEPFTRGVYPSMYRGREFTMRQLTGFGGPENTNQRIKFMLANGATGLNVLFDLPTIQMYDSDDPISRGQVGMSGVAIDSVDDMDIAFKDIPLDEVTVSLVTHFPSNTAILFPMYLAAAERRGIPFERLRGTVQNDTTMEEVVRSGSEYIPPEDCFRIQCDNIEFIRQRVPLWNFITFNGYNLREFGTSGITEMAVAMANAIASIEEVHSRGHDIDFVAERAAFFWSIGSDFFEEAARVRAARRLWYKIMKYRFGSKNKKSMLMRCHVQTSGISLMQQEPLNNVIRSAYHALSAVLGGVQSMHVDSFDEAYAVPTEQSALLALRNQRIIQTETGVTEVVDPLAGSFYVEALTNDIESRILEELDEIEYNGGYVKAVRDGWLHSRIRDHFQREQDMIENGEIKIVGYNVNRSSEAAPPIEVFQYPTGVEEMQKAKLVSLKLRRDNEKVGSCLNALSDACTRKKNILPYTLDCARNLCTKGEMFKVFKKSYGLWKPQVI